MTGIGRERPIVGRYGGSRGYGERPTISPCAGAEVGALWWGSQVHSGADQGWVGPFFSPSPHKGHRRYVVRMPGANYANMCWPSGVRGP
jgi:hypothetical protein